MCSPWVVLAFCCLGQLCADQSLKPQIAAPQLATNNPTLTTVALEKPFCMFDSSLCPNKSYVIYLYAMKESASAISSLVTDNSSKPLDSTFQQTSGGQLGPYKAALFNVPNCASPPRLADVGDVSKVSDVLKQYLFRVGDDGTCLYDPNFLAVCNPPLAPDTTYRFKYVLLDSTEGIMKDQTLWSDPIKTRRVKLPLKIDTWPGRRSGDMIVITSILSVLVFVLLAGFLTSVFSAVIDPAKCIENADCKCCYVVENKDKNHIYGESPGTTTEVLLTFKTPSLYLGFINVTRDGYEEVELEISFQEKL